MKKQSFLMSSAILIFSAVAAKLTGALFRIPLANLLGGTGMGYFSSAYGIFMTIYAVSVTGLPAAVAKLASENAALGRFSNLRKVRRTSIAFFSATGLAFTILLILTAYPFCLFTGGAETVPSVLMIAPSVFFGCVTSVYRGYYEGLRNMFPTAVSQIVEGIFKLVAGLAICMYVLKNPERFASLSRFFGDCGILPIAAAGAVLGITLSTAAGTIFLALRYKLYGDGISKEEILKTNGKNCLDSGLSIISQLMKIAVPVSLGALVSNLTSLIDLVTITRSLGRSATENPDYFLSLTGISDPAESATFLFGSFTGLAVTIFNLVPSFTNMFGKGIFPSVSEAYAKKDSAAVSACTEKAILSTAIIGFPAGLGISALSGEILGLLFPSKAVETAICTFPLSILGIAVVLLCLSTTAFSILQAVGRPDLPVKIMLAGVAVKLPANLLLVSVPKLNVSGAALSTLLCYAVICLLSVASLINMVYISRKRLFSALSRICYSSVICAVAAILCRNILTNAVTPLLVLFISIFIGAIFYIICSYLLGIFTKSTLKMLIS